MNVIEAKEQAFKGKSMPKVKIEIDTTDLDSLSNKIDVLIEKVDTLNQAIIEAKENLDALARYASS